MVKIRFFVYFVVLMIMVTCADARARSWNNFNHHEKRLFGCAEVGTSCKGVFSKSCCKGLKCHSTSGHCVASGGSSWLDDRNGK